MAFWCTRTLRERVEAEKLIVPYDPGRVKHSAYEMGVGREAYITSDFKKKTRVKTRVPPGEKIKIPPGQFGLLTTREVVSVPADTIAFISIRAGIKFRGLVNVSGFHVDPGYRGNLTFAVYNAGSQPIVLDQKEPVFMMWFSELDDVDDEPYKNKPRGRYLIDSERVRKIQGDVASPAELKKRIDELERKLTNAAWLLGILISIFGGLLAKGIYDSYFDPKNRPQATNGAMEQRIPPPFSSPIPSPQPNVVPVPATAEPSPHPQPHASEPQKDGPAPKEEKKPESPEAEPKGSDPPNDAGVG